MNKAVKLMYKMQCSPHNDGDSRNVRCLPRKAAGTERSQPKCKHIHVSGRSGLDAGLHKAIGSQMMKA